MKKYNNTKLIIKDCEAVGGLEIFATGDKCPMEYGREGTNQLCGVYQENLHDCVECWLLACPELENTRGIFKVGGTC